MADSENLGSLFSEFRLSLEQFEKDIQQVVQGFRKIEQEADGKLGDASKSVSKDLGKTAKAVADMGGKIEKTYDNMESALGEYQRAHHSIISKVTDKVEDEVNRQIKAIENINDYYKKSQADLMAAQAANKRHQMETREAQWQDKQRRQQIAEERRQAQIEEKLARQKANAEKQAEKEVMQWKEKYAREERELNKMAFKWQDHWRKKRIAEEQEAQRKMQEAYERRIDRMKGIAKGIAGAPGKALGAIGSVFKAIGGSIVVANQGLELMKSVLGSIKRVVVDIGGQFVNLAGKLERIQLSMGKIIGSTKEGTALFNEILQFASTVPFEAEKLLESGQNLLPILKEGKGELKGWLSFITDIAATTNLTLQETTSNFIKMYSAGAAAADLFRERGVLPLMGFTPGQEYSATETRERMKEIANDTHSVFNRMAQIVASTWEGQISMIKDEWTLFRDWVMRDQNLELENGKIIKEEGLAPFRVLKGIIRNINDLLDENHDKIKQVADAFGDYLSDKIAKTATYIGEMWRAFFTNDGQFTEKGEAFLQSLKSLAVKTVSIVGNFITGIISSVTLLLNRISKVLDDYDGLVNKLSKVKDFAKLMYGGFITPSMDNKVSEGNGGGSKYKGKKYEVDRSDDDAIKLIKFQEDLLGQLKALKTGMAVSADELAKDGETKEAFDKLEEVPETLFNLVKAMDKNADLQTFNNVVKKYNTMTKSQQNAISKMSTKFGNFSQKAAAAGKKGWDAQLNSLQEFFRQFDKIAGDNEMYQINKSSLQKGIMEKARETYNKNRMQELEAQSRELELQNRLALSHNELQKKITQNNFEYEQQIKGETKVVKEQLDVLRQQKNEKARIAYYTKKAADQTSREMGLRIAQAEDGSWRQKQLQLDKQYMSDVQQYGKVEADERDSVRRKKAIIDLQRQLNDELRAARKEIDGNGYAAQLKRINKEYQDIANSNAPQAVKELAKKIRDAKVQALEMEYPQGFMAGIKQGVDEAADKFKTLGQLGKDMMQEMSKAMADSFNTFFVDVIKGKVKSLGDYINNFLKGIAKAMANMASQQMASSMMSSIQAGFFHSGGVVGSGGNRTGSFPASLFAFAPRLHNGLMPDEYPAILQKGEAVIPKDKVGQGVSGPRQVDVKIHNESGQPMQATKARSQFNMQRGVVEVWLDAYQRNAHGLRDALGG